MKGPLHEERGRRAAQVRTLLLPARKECWGACPLRGAHQSGQFPALVLRVLFLLVNVPQPQPHSRREWGPHPHSHLPVDTAHLGASISTSWRVRRRLGLYGCCSMTLVGAKGPSPGCSSEGRGPPLDPDLSFSKKEGQVWGVPG